MTTLLDLPKELQTVVLSYVGYPSALDTITLDKIRRYDILSKDTFRLRCYYLACEEARLDSKFAAYKRLRQSRLN